MDRGSPDGCTAFPCQAPAISGNREFTSKEASGAGLFRLIGVNQSTAVRSLKAHLRIVLDQICVVKRFHPSPSCFFPRSQFGIPVLILCEGSRETLLRPGLENLTLLYLPDFKLSTTSVFLVSSDGPSQVILLARPFRCLCPVADLPTWAL